MRVLHAGCGGAPLPPYFGVCEEVRLDVSPDCAPDIQASVTEMGEVGAFDAVYCSHMLEHLYPHEVVKALREFRRVLAANNGYAIIFVPDLEGVTISDGILYQSPSGPVRAIDMFYGGLGLIQGHPYMAHHIGFTRETLEAVILTAGFAKANMSRLRDSYNLMAVAQV